MNKSAFVRINQIDKMIRSGQATSTDKLAGELEVTKRTVERDIATMKYELGADIVYNRTLKRYEYGEQALAVPAQWLSQKEIALMLISEKSMQMFTGTDFHKSIHPAFNHFLDPIREYKDDMDYIKNLCGSVYFNRSFEPMGKLKNKFSTMLNAIMEQKVVTLYYSKNSVEKPTKRTIEPYTLVNNDNEWQFIGYCRKNRRIKTFSLQKASRIKTLDLFCDSPVDYDPDDFITHKFDAIIEETPVYDIKIKISKTITDMISSTLWHPTQEIIESKNFDYITLQGALTNELICWILSLGSDATVVKPKILRDKIREQVELTLMGYN